MICPHCNCNLESVADRDLPVYNCPGCSGTWISGRSLHAMLAKSSDSASIEQILNSILNLDYQQSRRQCPACAGRYLKVVVIETTELDFCSSCKGLFFDPGELERVLPTVVSQGGKPARSGQDESQRGFWSSLKRMLDAN
jgi:Zn-finger nucleic acid-binding protein